MMYLGNYATGATIDFLWSSNDGSGASITRGTNGTISVYKGNGTTQSTAGVTDDEDFDSLTGIHHVRITTGSDGSFYAGGNDFAVVLSGATIDGKAVNAVLAHFSLQNRYPAVADVQSGLATSSALSTVAGYVDTEVAAIKAKTDLIPASPAAEGSAMTLADGAITSAKFATGAITAGAIAADAIGASELAADAVAEIQSGLATASALRTVAGYVDTEVAAIKAKTDLIPASPAAVGSAMTLAADAVNSTSLAASAVAEIQSGLSTLTAGDVNAQMVDVLVTDTFGEPGSVPGATSSLKDKINWLFILARNKRTTTATADKVRNDGDSADVGSAVLSDDGSTFTRGEYA